MFVFPNLRFFWMALEKDYSNILSRLFREVKFTKNETGMCICLLKGYLPGAYQDDERTRK
ncbi:MAG: hypothetical protein EA409_11905 [Saprospirales bacterium]|nr:MAG: hypothetical protein EA409_11905 [Saprospirales bacterium]